MAATLHFKRVDVRQILESGGEPLDEIRSKLGDLKNGEGLEVLAPFLPSPLIGLLQSEGYQSKIQRGAGTDWIVRFWK